MNREKAQRRFVFDSSMEEEIYEQGESAEKICFCISCASCKSGNDIYIYYEDKIFTYLHVPQGLK